MIAQDRAIHDHSIHGGGDSQDYLRKAITNEKEKMLLAMSTGHVYQIGGGRSRSRSGMDRLSLVDS